jgi:hypothetical protein
MAQIAAYRLDAGQLEHLIDERLTAGAQDVLGAGSKGVEFLPERPVEFFFPAARFVQPLLFMVDQGGVNRHSCLVGGLELLQHGLDVVH